MTTSNERSAAMADGRRADSQRRRQRVAKALQTAAASGAEISISAIARAAGVDRSFFYRPQHRDLLAAVQAAAIEPRDSVVGPVASRASLQADLANSQDRCKRLADHVSLLEKRLSGRFMAATAPHREASEGFSRERRGQTGGVFDVGPGLDSL
jgi:uncharacterized protein HemX